MELSILYTLWSLLLGRGLDRMLELRQVVEELVVEELVVEELVVEELEVEEQEAVVTQE